MWQNKRSYTQEILDKGPDHYSSHEYHHCLELLNRVNWLLGGFRASKKAFSQLKTPPESILEIGCGGGYFCQLLKRWYPQARIIGTDLNPSAIEHAIDACPLDLSKTIKFELQKTLELPYLDNSFTVVTTMLVSHHMTDEELIVFLKECYRICSQAVILNDLHRHFLAYASFSFIAPLFFPNRLIWNDGRLSVKRSFQKKDWIDLLEKAGFKRDQYTLRWHWAFRWTLTLRKQ
jgi:ubiquinone/menaquinone biosynthesis C-methylase UbiE